MCTYCFIADFFNKYVPNPYPVTPFPQPQPWSPWNPYPNPTGPAPTTPPLSPMLPLPPLPFGPTPIHQPYPAAKPWTQEQLDEAREILRQVKEMEDALGGCPCEDPSKMDFLDEIQKRLDHLKGQKDAEPTGEAHPISS